MESAMTSTRTIRHSRRRQIVLSALVALVLAAAGIALVIGAQLDLGAPVSGVTDVAVRDDEFVPAAIKVPAGTTVTWRWAGENEHNVVGDGFASPVQTEGAFSKTFADPGAFAYRCTLHAFMRGEIIVTEEQRL